MLKMEMLLTHPEDTFLLRRLFFVPLDHWNFAMGKSKWCFHLFQPVGTSETVLHIYICSEINAEDLIICKHDIDMLETRYNWMSASGLVGYVLFINHLYLLPIVELTLKQNLHDKRTTSCGWLKRR